MRRPGSLRRVAVSLLALGLLAVACGNGNGSSGRAGQSRDASLSGLAGDGGATCSQVSLGFFGALSGVNANLGINMRKGAALAVGQFNVANPKCAVALKDFDSQGIADVAPSLADQAIADPSIVGIIGPAFSGEASAALPRFDAAGMPIITPSATNPSLSQQGWSVFHRALAGDDKQGPAIAKYIRETLAPRAVGVIHDGSEYGKGLADIVRAELGSVVREVQPIDPHAMSYAVAVTKMRAANVDVIFYGGYYAEAALLAKQLRDADDAATLVFGDGVMDNGFIEDAGAAAEGSIVTCTCAPVDSDQSFLDAYGKAYGEVPAAYSAEAYDSANAFLAGISAGKTARQAINDFLATYDVRGVTKRMKWTSTGEVEGGDVYVYLVKSGHITSAATISKA
jgi:branched-chain amino acid transport system substrate-binding protein